MLFILIDHSMVLGYNHSKQNRQWWWTNAPHPPAVSMATAVRRSNTDGIAQCGMSRATSEATGHQHWVTTCSVLPQQLQGQQSTNTQTKLAVLMAMAMRRYVTAHIAPWRRSRAMLDATGRHQWASIAANNSNWSRKRRFYQSLFILNSLQKGLSWG